MEEGASGRVEAIHTGAVLGGPIESVAAVAVEAGLGIAGDRKHGLSGRGSNLTLIAAEGIEAMVAETGIPLQPAETRRNILTRGVDLGSLIGRRFRLGEAVCLGIGPCDPCAHLESLTRPGVLRGLVGRGGLRADVLASGSIRVGDTISRLGEETDAATG